MSRSQAMRVLAMLLGLFGFSGNAAEPQLQPGPASVESIGRALVEAVGTSEAVILLYAQFDEGMVATAIRYVPTGGAVISDIADQPDALHDALSAAWETVRAQMQPEPWREMIYVVDNGQVSVTLLYPEQIDPGRTLHEKVEAESERLFPGLPHVADLTPDPGR